MASEKCILLEKPGVRPVKLTRLVLDYNGTLAFDGELMERVSELITLLSRNIQITVVTSDTFGTARERLKALPLEVQIAEGGWVKKKFVTAHSGEGVIAIGNGVNDIEMFQQAEISIAVIGPEGVAAELLRVATVVVTRIEDALGLLLNPKRLTATLRP